MMAWSRAGIQYLRGSQARQVHWRWLLRVVGGEANERGLGQGSVVPVDMNQVLSWNFVSTANIP